MELKYRERQILEQLLIKTSIKGNEVSLILGASDRTIRNYIRRLNEFLKTKDILIFSSNLLGYYLELTEEKRSFLRI